MLNEVYNKRILELAADIPHIGTLKDPDARAQEHSPLCGSKVSVEIKATQGVVTDFAHEVQACALGQAASSIMARNVIGSDLTELEQVLAAVEHMLATGELDIDEKWKDLEVLKPVKDFKQRHGSTLLTFKAVVAALKACES